MTEDKEHQLVSMSLGDHLEELRSRLILMVIGLVIGLIVCLFFGKFFVKLLTNPYVTAVNKSLITEEKTQDDKDTETKTNDQQTGEAKITTTKPDDSDETAAAELEDLTKIDNSMHSLTTIKPAEGFIVYLKVSMFFGVLLVSPWLFWQIWAFVSAGLYQKEKRFVHAVAPISAALFVAGALFFIFVIAPLAIGFFIKFNNALSLRSNWTFQEYIGLVIALTLVFGLAFQMPLAIVFANLMGLLKVETLTKNRRIVILGIFIVAAMATPPDPVSQVSLALPLYALFEGSIIACKILKRTKS